VRDRDMTRVDRQRDLESEVRNWAERHRRATIEEAVLDLEIHDRANDRDAQWLVWRHLPHEHPAWKAFTADQSLPGTAG